MKNIYKCFREVICKEKLIKNGEKILVGVSGGPDSICLLNLLIKVKKNYNLKIIIAHYNHSLRGKDSDYDEKFIQKIALKNKLDFISKKEDVLIYQKKNKICLIDICDTSDTDEKIIIFVTN